MACSSSEWMAIYGDEEEEDTGDFLKQWGFQKTACQKCNLVLKDNQDFLIQCSKCKNAYYCSSKCFNADIDAHQKQCETGELAHDISSYSFSRKNLPEDKIDGKRKQQKVEDQKQNPPKSTRKKSKPKTEEKEIPPKRKSSPKKTLKKKKKSLPEEKKEPAGKPSDHQDKERGLEMVDKELQTDKEDRLELSNIEIIPGEDDETKDDLNSAIPFSISTKEIDNNDGTELLAVTREALTAENISRMLLRLPPGKIFPCRCASATCARARAQGINDGKSTKRPPRLPPRLPSMCPDCSAGLCWPESEINGTGPTIRTECPDCATIVTVPRIQIEEATHEKAPKKPSRPSKDETSTPMSPPKPPARLPSMCPDCSAGLCWPESEINGTGPTLRMECPDCATTVTVPRIQIEEATHENAPKKPSRVGYNTLTPRSPPKPPARLPSMCPDCSAGLCWPESEINGTGPTIRTECPDCATIVTVPRIQIEEATHEKAPKKPSRPSKDETSTPMSPPKPPARLPSMCPDCSAGLCWPESEINGTGPTLRMECPDCATTVTVPRIQIEEATHENAPKKPSRPSMDEISTPMSPPKTSARLPCTCPSCKAHICWHDCEVKGTGATMHTVCPECASIIVVPRIQINDATHLNSPKKPTRIDNDMASPRSPPKPPARLPSMCPSCSAGLCWRHSDVNSRERTVSTVCPECDSNIIVPRIQINDATHESAPKRPWREYSDEKMQLPAKCLECNVDLYWPDSEINGSGLTLQTVCADCAAIITVPRIQNNGPTDDNAPKKPCRCLEHDCCPIIKDGGTVTTQSESLTEESIYSESSRSQSRVSQNNGPVSPLKIGDIVGPRPRANPCRCSVHGGDCPHVLLAEAKARGGPPRMPVRCGGCEGFMTWPRETIGKAKPFADNTKLRGEDLTGCTLQVPYLSDRCQDDSLTDSEGSESSEYSKPILEFRLKCTMKESDDQESNHPGDESSRQWTLGVKKLNYSPSVRTYECDTSSQASTGQFSIDLRTAEIQKHELLSYRPEWATNPQLRRTLSLNQATRTPGKDQPEWTKMANIKQKNFVEVLQSDGVEKKKTVLPSTPEWVINPPIKKRTTNRRVSPVHKKGSQQLSTKPTIVLEP